ncbi:hypothetical protein F4778DRAFT_474126 [Xylariomycetidae sp. FL2044]|nr:hypothetical protein F4778DRAFT_474126 [Xylariomycetidae sp. FL2044]
MFDHQWPESTRKRSREDDEVYAEGTLGFTEHRNKRLQSLPLRTSPPQKRWSHPPSFPNTQADPATVTPADSDSEDMQNLRQTNLSMDVDRDTDMMVDGCFAPEHLEPGPAQPDPIAPSITGRMPTPIHPTFSAQVRGNNWPMNQAGPSAHQRMHAAILESDSGISAPAPFFPPGQDPSIPRTMEGAAEWSIVQNRRLPSPISENGGEETPTSPGMVLDSCSPATPQQQLQRPYLPHMPHSMNPHAMAMHPNIHTTPQHVESDAAMMDTDGGSPTSAPATPSPRGKYGHSRSKHTLNNWTIQPGMKKSFSIGYRADCEKCRMKIPGHFNHIIIS